MDTKELTTWINNLISINRLDKFYHSKYFKKVKREVLREQHYECQHCRDKGKLTIVKENRKRSGVVHHMLEVRKRPDLALSKYYIDEQGKKQRQLIVLCNEHHELIHDRYVQAEYKPQLNEERY